LKHLADKALAEQLAGGGLVRNVFSLQALLILTKLKAEPIA